ncbi:unnamed protein product [marine sediment metagenome]|uniref:Uncharacterized protein n=1 Tax=marine sediment metagenome TaxID=412755 RepID=X1B6U6_9ZZZZ
MHCDSVKLIKVESRKYKVEVEEDSNAVLEERCEVCGKPMHFIKVDKILTLRNDETDEILSTEGSFANRIKKLLNERQAIETRGCIIEGCPKARAYTRAMEGDLNTGAQEVELFHIGE